MEEKRISREEMFMEIAKLVSQRMTCTRAKVGALIVKDNRIISTGYGGAPSGLPHCTDVGCILGPDGGCISTAHAEANAISFAAREGIAVKGSDMYVTLSPCLNCAKLIINSGIITVYYLEEYRDDSALRLLRNAGVSVVNYPEMMQRRQELEERGFPPHVGLKLDRRV